jgi:gliotoxin biosynthesis N-methyltransferase
MASLHRLTGTWLRDLQSSIPTSNNTYIGIDIEAELFPSQLPSGMTLVGHDFTKPWPSDWHNSFDLVHLRFCLGASGTYPVQDVVTSLTGLVKPGGWMELVEADVDMTQDAGPALTEYIQLLREIFTLAGVGGNLAPRLRRWLEAAGLEAVEERHVDVATGVKNPRPELVEKGINGTCSMIDPLIAMAISRSQCLLLTLQRSLTAR